MNKRYSIGFFMIIVVFTLAFMFVYKWSYDRTIEKSEKINEEMLSTDGSAQKEDGYVICERDGYVIVYLSDLKTVYEYTTIEVKMLPENLQEELKTGKKVGSLGEVYGFLENYSS